MACDDGSFILKLDKNHFLNEQQESRSLTFPDGITRIITVKKRVWSWYDTYMARHPLERQKFKSFLLETSSGIAELRNRPLEQELRFGFEYLMQGLNRKELQRNSGFLDR